MHDLLLQDRENFGGCRMPALARRHGRHADGNTIAVGVRALRLEADDDGYRPGWRDVGRPEIVSRFEPFDGAIGDSGWRGFPR